MPNLSLLPTFLREVLGPRSLSREPEPAMVVEDAEQVAAFVEGGRSGGFMAAAHLFHAARASQVLQGSRMVFDLGCGPATQLAQIAGLNRHMRFVGVDLSARMLKSAHEHTRSLRLSNVRLLQEDITTLKSLPDASADGVISTFSLHHLPTREHLEKCFRAIRRVLKPGGRLYLSDFGRLKSLESVLFFVRQDTLDQPPALVRDYEHSLRAAFRREDFAALADRFFEPQVEVVGTFKVPFLITVKTQDHSLPPALSGRLHAMRDALPRKHRGELDDLRWAFRLGGGLRNDPFKR